MPVNLSNLIAECYPALNASSQADLEFWTDANLTRFALDAAARLGRRVAVFTEREALIAVAAGGDEIYPPAVPLAGYVLPIHATANGKALREIAGWAELDAIASDWRSRTATEPVYYYSGSLRNDILFYPRPSAPWVGEIVFQGVMPFGAPAPFTAPVPSLLAAAVYGVAKYGLSAYGGTGMLTGTYRYYVTYVTNGAKESNPGPVSDDITANTQNVLLSNLPVAPYSNVIARRIYRGGGAQPGILLIGTVQNNTATHAVDGVTEAQAIAMNHPLVVQEVSSPDVLQDFFRLEMIAGARGHESDGAMPETSAWLLSVTKLMEDVANVYWGAAKGL